MDYTLTKRDVEKLLGKSSKTVGRYIKDGRLHPIKKMREGYLTYLFNLEDIEGLMRGQGRHEGQGESGQGTHGETFSTGKNTNNTGRVNNLHGETQGTNEGTNKSKNSTPQDIGDRTQEGETLAILKDTIAILKEQLDRQDKQIGNLTQTMQYVIKENTNYAKLLGLPMPTNNEVVDIDEGTNDRTRDIQETGHGTNDKTPTKTNPINKAKVNHKTKGQTTGQKTKTVQPIKVEVKPEAKNGFNLFNWFTGKK